MNSLKAIRTSSAAFTLRTAHGLALFTLAAVVALSGCGSEQAADESTPQAETPECLVIDAPPASKEAKMPPAEAPDEMPSRVTLKTNQGDITIKFDSKQTPCTVSNFLSLAKQGFYDNTDCHRLTTSNGLYVLQCGDPIGTGAGGPGYTIGDELIENDERLQPCRDVGGVSACTYPKGTVAMAKTALPNSAGSQFFLVYQNSTLPNEYTAFGRMDAASVRVVRKIAKKGLAGGGVAPKAATTIELVE